MQTCKDYLLYLHEQEAALLRTGSVKHKSHSSNRKWLPINELRFADEPVHVNVKDEVRIILVTFITIDVITDASPTIFRNTTFIYMYVIHTNTVLFQLST